MYSVATCEDDCKQVLQKKNPLLVGAAGSGSSGPPNPGRVTIAIDRGYFEHKLGATATKIWLRLVEVRSQANGLVSGEQTAKRLGRDLGIGYRSVEQALHRLRDFGLWKRHHYVAKELRPKTDTLPRRVRITTVRSVLGSVCEDSNPDIPVSALQKFIDAGRGGIRIGSGRKAKGTMNRASEAHFTIDDETQRLVPETQRNHRCKTYGDPLKRSGILRVNRILDLDLSLDRKEEEENRENFGDDLSKEELPRSQPMDGLSACTRSPTASSTTLEPLAGISRVRSPGASSTVNPGTLSSLRSRGEYKNVQCKKEEKKEEPREILQLTRQRNGKLSILSSEKKMGSPASDSESSYEYLVSCGKADLFPFVVQITATGEGLLPECPRIDFRPSEVSQVISRVVDSSKGHPRPIKVLPRRSPKKRSQSQKPKLALVRQRRGKVSLPADFFTEIDARALEVEQAVAREQERIDAELTEGAFSGLAKPDGNFFGLLRAICAHDRFPLFVPDPPFLSEADPILKRAQYLATLYESFCKKYYDKDVYIFSRGIAASKHCKLLCDAAQCLTELGLAPACWYYYASDIWDYVSDGENPPPLKFLFSGKFIEKKFDDVVDGSCFSRSLLRAEATVELVDRWALYLVDASRVSHDRDRLVATYREHFPDGLREQLCLRAAKETEQLRQRVTADVNTGGWVW
jgi:hypothetical protein